MPGGLQLAHEAGDGLRGHAEVRRDGADGPRAVQEALHDVAVRAAQALEPLRAQPGQDPPLELVRDETGGEGEIEQVEDVRTLIVALHSCKHIYVMISYIHSPRAADADAVRVARRALELIADLDAPLEQFAALLAPDYVLVEHPNALRPHGRRASREEALASFAAGRSLLAMQRLDVHELLAGGRSVAVRATWRGVLATAFPGLPAGAELRAEVAQFLTVRDGLLVRQETFDCYEPMPAA